MNIKGFEIDTDKEAHSFAYLVGDTFEIYYDGFTLIKQNCSIEEVKEICEKLNIDGSELY